MQSGGSAGEVKVRIDAIFLKEMLGVLQENAHGRIIILMCNVIKQCRKGSFEFLKKAMKNGCRFVRLTCFMRRKMPLNSLNWQRKFLMNCFTKRQNNV